jgi:glycosyltransferase involved in cell wall biosynthesis
VTQLGAVALIEGAQAHVLRRPAVRYLDGLRITEHGVLPWERFIRLQAGVDLNLYVSLSECQPLTPIESYAAGVPCLMSRTSAVFRDDPELWALTAVDEADDPEAIAAAARRLLESRRYAVEAARRWIDRAEADAAVRWSAFVQAVR